MSENELTIGKNDIFDGSILVEGLEHLGNLNYPCAQKNGIMYQYLYTSDKKSAERIVEAEANERKRNCVLGLTVDLMRFFNTGEINFEDDRSGVGIWVEIGEVPELFRSLKGNKNV